MITLIEFRSGNADPVYLKMSSKKSASRALVMATFRFVEDFQPTNPSRPCPPGYFAAEYLMFLEREYGGHDAWIEIQCRPPSAQRHMIVECDPQSGVMDATLKGALLRRAT